MSPSPRTRLFALALTVATLPTLAACGAGFDASVDEVTGHNAAGSLNGILARDIVVVKAPQSTSAALAGTLINGGRKADTLQTVSFTDDAPGSQTMSISPNVALAAGQVLSLGSSPITIPDAHAITVGDFIYVDLHFAQAGDMHMQVAAADRSFYFSNIGGGSTAAPTAASTEADAPGRGAFSKTKIVTDSAKSTKPTVAPSAAPAAKPAAKPAVSAKPTTTVKPQALARPAGKPVDTKTAAPKATATAKPAAAAPAATAPKPAAAAPAAVAPSKTDTVTKPDPTAPRPQ